MPITREITAEEDVTLSTNTMVTGLLVKYAKHMSLDALAASIAGNVAININQIVTQSALPEAQKAAVREAIIEHVKKALEVKRTNAAGEDIGEFNKREGE